MRNILAMQDLDFSSFPKVKPLLDVDMNTDPEASFSLVTCSFS